MIKKGRIRKKGWVRKSTKDEYLIGGLATSIKGRIRKKEWVRKSTKDEYPTGGGPFQKRGGLGMSTGQENIKSTTLVARMNLSYHDMQ